VKRIFKLWRLQFERTIGILKPFFLLLTLWKGIFSLLSFVFCSSTRGLKKKTAEIFQKTYIPFHLFTGPHTHIRTCKYNFYFTKKRFFLYTQFPLHNVALITTMFFFSLFQNIFSPTLSSVYKKAMFVNFHFFFVFLFIWQWIGKKTEKLQCCYPYGK
jgi:hypothetical protein